jgi:hypothetical protein
MIGRDFHAYFQLPAARQTFCRIKQFFSLFSVEDIAAGIARHNRYSFSAV